MPSDAPVPVLPLWRRLLYSVFIVGVLLGVPETVLRIFWSPVSHHEVGTRQFVNWLSELSVGQDRSAELYEDDPDLLWRLKAGVAINSFNFHRAKEGENQPIHITVNPSGFRGPLVSPAATSRSDVRVLCMGDSNFFGYPLDDTYTFPEALQREMQARIPGHAVSTINGGVPGYTVLQGLRWYRSQFDQYDFNWLLLSYLNNDAWRQPASDRDLFQRRHSFLGRYGSFASGLSRHIYIVQFLQSLIKRHNTRAKADVPRVSLEDFVSAYREFIVAARQHGAMTLILDYRAYKEYEPYSKALRQLAKDENVGYLPVAPLVMAASNEGPPPAQYHDLAEQVSRRWGRQMLQEHPYLWYYAEFHPEHLNEVGTAWLAQFIAPGLSGPAAEASNNGAQ